MMKEKLFEAIGGLDEKLLAESENIKAVRSGRVLRRALLVAALMAGLAISAGAAPLFRSALQGGSIRSDDTAYFSPTDPQTGESYQSQLHEVSLEVLFNENAPGSVETYYILEEVPEEFTQYHGYVYRDACLAQFGWIVEGTGRMIYFTQQAGGTVAEDDLSVSVYTQPGGAVEHRLRTIAGIQGYLIEIPTLGEDYGEREFYWSDGDYLFSLEVPCDYSDAELERLLASVRPVEDITPYLCSMTDPEIGDILG